MLDWVLGLIGLLTALYWFLTRNHGYWKDRGVHTPPGSLPGVGHMWDVFVFKKCPQWIHCEIYNQTRGLPAVGLYDFRKPGLLVRDLSLVQTVLVSDFTSFHENYLFVDETIDPYVAKNPFALRGQQWRTLRQKLAPAMSPARIKNMFPSLEKVCKEFNTYIENHIHEQEINIKHVTGLFTSEVVANCAFGVEGNAFKDPNAEFYQQGRKMWDGTLYSPVFMFIMTYLPSINKILRRSFFPKELVAFFTELIKQAADYRAKNQDKVLEDYLQYLFGLSKKDPDFTLEDVVAQSLTFFTDGFETSSVMASFALYELTVNPDIQDHLRREVQAMDAFTYENIAVLPLLDRVFNETLRKYSVVSLIKECTQDTVLQTDGFCCTVSKGTHVFVPAYAIHHDPEIYPNPEQFDPDRFLPENVKQRHPMAFLGFGAGPRTCIGYRLATAQVKVLLANVVAHFKLLKSNKTVEDINLIKTLVIPVPDEEICVKFEKL